MIKLSNMLRSALTTGYNWIKDFKRQRKSLVGVLRHLALLEESANARPRQIRNEKNIMNKIGKHMLLRQEKNPVFQIHF